MSHSTIPAEMRSVRQLPPDLVRVSVGIEDIDGLLADLDQALSNRHAQEKSARQR